MSSKQANHYFSPRKFASANRAREILDSLRLSLPTVAPGQTPGALRFVSLALHILPQKGGRHRRNVSARKVSESVPSSGNAFLYSFHCKLLRTPLRRKPHSTQQAWMYSRNQTTIASCCKHRQPVFLHPTFEREVAKRCCRDNDRIATGPKSVATKRRTESRSHVRPMHPDALRLPIPPPASTLQVFQFIRTLVLRQWAWGRDNA